jgi:uncharacterized membrane protein YedE/YeeE
MNIFISLLAGILFGLALIISQMINPSKIIKFLTISSDWDPSLIFVMTSAILVSYFAFACTKKMKTSFLHMSFEIPKRKNIDSRLIMGSALFGIGWGMIGYCPAPAITSLFLGNPQSLLFVSSMLTGIYLFKITNKHFLSES